MCLAGEVVQLGCMKEGGTAVTAGWRSEIDGFKAFESYMHM